MELSPFHAPAPWFVFTLIMFSVVGKFCVANTSHPSTYLVLVVALMNLFSPTFQHPHNLVFKDDTAKKSRLNFP